MSENILTKLADLSESKLVLINIYISGAGTGHLTIDNIDSTRNSEFYAPHDTPIDLSSDDLLGEVSGIIDEWIDDTEAAITEYINRKSAD